MRASSSVRAVSVVVSLFDTVVVSLFDRCSSFDSVTQVYFCAGRRLHRTDRYVGLFCGST